MAEKGDKTIMKTKEKRTDKSKEREAEKVRVSVKESESLFTASDVTVVMARILTGRWTSRVNHISQQEQQIKSQGNKMLIASFNFSTSAACKQTSGHVFGDGMCVIHRYGGRVASYPDVIVRMHSCAKYLEHYSGWLNFSPTHGLFT